VENLLNSSKIHFMWTKHKYALLLLLAPIVHFAQNGSPIIYIQLDTVALQMDICYPLDLNPSQTYPALVFFHGGGWRKGNRNQFAKEASNFADRGFISFLIEYRVSSVHQTTPFDALSDVKSAIRHIREHAAGYQIDANKVIVIGSSAGGQLALATAFTSKYNDPEDSIEISSVPNGIVLYNPILDTGPGSFGYGRIGNEYLNFSPLHTIRAIEAPTLIFLGTDDRYISESTAQLFVQRMKDVGNSCELVLFPNATHGLFDKKLNLREILLEKSLTFLNKYQ